MKRLMKQLLFPGLDLHTRCRYRWLPPLFSSGPIETLDVGFGNGACCLAAARKGNSVLGISLDQTQVEKARALFTGGKFDRLNFQNLNAYNLRNLGRRFDQIICLETLEHISDDKGIVRLFWELLRPNGVLHLCCPHALHPVHNLGRVNGPEDGGHVRDGYTLDSYRKLLEPVGFVIEKHLGLGTESLVAIDAIIRHVRNRYGDAAALPLFLLLGPFAHFLDHPDPDMPLSLHVVARRPV
jgi:SAM-dependent methyltransferase